MPSLGFSWPRLGMAAGAIHWHWGPTPGPRLQARTDADASRRSHLLCSRGPTPARSRCGARRLAVLARAAGAWPRLGTPPQRGCRAGDPGMDAGAIDWRWGPTPAPRLQARTDADASRWSHLLCSRCGARRLAVLARAAGAWPRLGTPPQRGCRAGDPG